MATPFGRASFRTHTAVIAIAAQKKFPKNKQVGPWVLTLLMIT